MSAMPVMIVVLCVLAIAYRYYSAFIAAKVLALDPAAVTPAHRFNDGQNFHPTSKWVLFGHHFAAISGAGPLIGPVLAAQFGYLPGLIWIVVGVCLAGAVQDFMVLVISSRHGGKSLGQIAYAEINKVAGHTATIAILIILVVAIAGLGKVVVKALGGETIKMPDGSTVLTPGSSWGTFTIACTIPIALFVGLWMYRIRKGRVIEASIIGGALTLGATFLGGYLASSSFAHWFELSSDQVKWSMAVYGFAAAVLPVWILLVPRDYLSSFLKIGTIALLIIGTIIANPKLETPAFNHTFFSGGPIVREQIFPFLFITIMCGAISGFHALIASGTTSKMLMNEVHARTIGYGAMLIEGTVAVVAMIAAASLPVQDYYAMNTEIAAMPAWNDRILQVGGAGGVEHLNQYESLTQESLRGRTGGAVTLAVGMANIFDKAARGFAHHDWLNAMWKYWYHFAIMFEALFILTTIDAGTRVGRFLLQEMAGKLHPRLGFQGGIASAVICTALIVLGWVYILGSGSFATIWAIFGIANQMLAVLALGVVTSYLVNTSRRRFAWVTIVPMMVVFVTTTSAAVSLLNTQVISIRTQVANTGWTLANLKLFDSMLQATLNVCMITCTLIIVTAVARRIFVPLRPIT
jgi:carbon starvation protein